MRNFMDLRTVYLLAVYSAIYNGIFVCDGQKINKSI